MGGSRRSTQTLLGHLDAPLPDVPNHGRGRDALATDMLAVYMSGWTSYSAELKEMVDAGDHVVLVLHETAKMRDSGVPLDRDLVHVQYLRAEPRLLRTVTILKSRGSAHEPEIREFDITPAGIVLGDPVTSEQVSR